MRVRRNDCPTHGLLASYRLGLAVLETLDPVADREESEEIGSHLDFIWNKLSPSERTELTGDTE